MPLHFFGRGSAFADEHNSAFFVENNELVIIDCPATSFQKVKQMAWDKFDNIYILVTHTHGDHTGGVGMLLQFVWFASGMKKRTTIVAPSEAVKDDLILLLNRIEGCEPNWYAITIADDLHKKWLVKAVPTTHTMLLEGKCYGYQLKVDDTNVVYTGDTATLEPFMSLLSAGTHFYTEVSTFQSDVHLYIDDILPTLEKLSQTGVNVFLMHLDDESTVNKKIDDTLIRLAPLYSGCG